MYDYTELTSLLDASAVSRATICKAVGINPSTLSKSLKNGTELSHNAVVGLSKYLGVKKAAEIDRIFFTQRVENTQLLEGKA